MGPSRAYSNLIWQHQCEMPSCPHCKFQLSCPHGSG
ncbi:MAG: Cas8a1 family CRISPR/Cas system-associated protein [Halobacteriota archaeon]